MRKKVAIIFGGQSAEHEVSLRSAKNIALAMDQVKYEFILVGISQQGTWYQFPDLRIFDQCVKLKDGTIPVEGKNVALIRSEGKTVLFDLKSQTQLEIDCAFPIIHGTRGEDGTLQGLFKMMNIPFVGCGVLASAVGMDKEMMKRILNVAGIKNAKYRLLTPFQKNDFQSLVMDLGLPFFIKPANAGSSVGVHKIKSESEFQDKLKDAFLYDYKVLAEEFIEGREIEISVMGLNHEPKASLPGEVIPQHEFYSYEAKYLDDNGALLQIPAQVDEVTVQRMQKLACDTYQALGCDGFTRVDFFMKKNGELYINEVNTLPGFTKISMYPKMWEASGLKYSDLISELIDLAFKKDQMDAKLVTTYLD